jgi:hypothetical protein
MDVQYRGLSKMPYHANKMFIIAIHKNSADMQILRFKDPHIELK